MKKIIGIVIVVFIIMHLLSARSGSAEDAARFWEFQSVDTMKYSRDIAREKLNDPSFNREIAVQVKNIARTGATHIAIATPYDEEFIPYLERWVKEARKHNLKVWFRGNWSGWERWFDYPSITRQEHIDKSYEFIVAHPDLFEDGDVFSACPECENGGPGDPRRSGDVEGHRQFLIDEYMITKKAFQEIDRDVASNYASMNGDVARLIMDVDTTRSLDGIVVIDHYVGTPDKLASDIADIAEQSGGQVVLGEFGAPILDIHGSMTEGEQRRWIDDALYKLTAIDQLVGVSYWVNKGGSTELWHDDNSPRVVVETLSSYYNPAIYRTKIVDEFGRSVSDVTIKRENGKIITSTDGSLIMPLLHNDEVIRVSADGYTASDISLLNAHDKIILEKSDPSALYRFFRFFTFRK